MKKQKVFRGITCILPLLLFGIVAYCSYGYDDEYFNITNMEKFSSVIDYYHWLNSTDIHPPLSYLINYGLFYMVKDWRLVRCIGALVVAAGLWIFWIVREKNISAVSTDKMESFFSYLLICLNPTVLLWATGIRWYTYMTFLVCVMGLLFYAKGALNDNKYLFWGTYFSLCVIIFHMEYSGAVLILASFICFLVKRREAFKKEWYVIVMFGVIAVAAVSYQVYIFLTVHYLNGQHEIGSILKAVVYTGQHLLCGQAVVPVSIFGIFLLVGNGVLYLNVLMNCSKLWKKPTNCFLVLAYVGIILSGIGIKIRNYTPLSPILGGTCRESYSLLQRRWLKYVCFWLILIGTIGGLYNVVSHTNTTKASWNTPYEDIVDYVCTYNDLGENVLVVSHNPVVDYWIKKETEIGVLNIANDYSGWYEKVTEHQGTLIILDSYKGSLHIEAWQQLQTFLKQSTGYIVEHTKFGKDRYSWFKQILDKDYPDYYMEIYIIKR